MWPLIAGNLLNLGALITDTLSGTRREQRQILGLQTASQVFYGVGSLILGGYSGAAQNGVAILRNLAAMKNLRQKWIGWLFVAMGVALGAWVNNLGLIGWLPIAANFGYSVAVVCSGGNGRILKYALVPTALSFSVFSLVILNFVGVVGNTVVAVVTLISLIKERRERKEEEDVEGETPSAGE